MAQRAKMYAFPDAQRAQDYVQAVGKYTSWAVSGSRTSGTIRAPGSLGQMTVSLRYRISDKTVNLELDRAPEGWTGLDMLWRHLGQLAKSFGTTSRIS